MTSHSSWSPGTHVLVDHAAQIARQVGSAWSSEEHLLLALCELSLVDWFSGTLANSPDAATESSLCMEFEEARSVLEAVGAHPQRCAQLVRNGLRTGRPVGPEVHVSRTPGGRRAFGGALRYCREQGIPQIRPVHVYSSLVATRAEDLRRVLDQMRVEEAATARAVQEADRRWRAHRSPATYATRCAVRPKRLLPRLGTDITALAMDRVPSFGREATISDFCARLHEHLAPVPLLIGPTRAGVEAVVWGTARRIADGTAPARLLGCRLWCIDVSLLLSLTEDEWVLLGDDTVAGDDILFLDPLDAILNRQPAPAGAEGAYRRCSDALRNRTFRACGTVKPETLERSQSFSSWCVPCEVPDPAPHQVIQLLGAVVTELEDFWGIEINGSTIRQVTEKAGHSSPQSGCLEGTVQLLEAAVRLSRQQGS